jgi:hypothetical protein
MGIESPFGKFCLISQLEYSLLEVTSSSERRDR